MKKISLLTTCIIGISLCLSACQSTDSAKIQNSEGEQIQNKIKTTRTESKENEKIFHEETDKLIHLLLESENKGLDEVESLKTHLNEQVEKLKSSDMDPSKDRLVSYLESLLEIYDQIKQDQLETIDSLLQEVINQAIVLADENYQGQLPESIDQLFSSALN